MAEPSIISWNAQGLNEKVDELVEFLSGFSLFIAGVSDCRLPSTVVGSGYIHSRYRGMDVLGFPESSRGLLVFVSSGVQYQPLRKFCLRAAQFTLVSIRIQSFVIIFCYVPDGSSRSGLENAKAIFEQVRTSSLAI
jgi:exonuclease III